MVFSEIVLKKSDNQQNQTRHLFHAARLESVRLNSAEWHPDGGGGLGALAVYFVTEFSSGVWAAPQPLLERVVSARSTFFTH